MDKSTVVKAICLHYIIFRCKAELDQLKSGLGALGVANSMQANPILFEKMFTVSGQVKLTPGESFCGAQ